MNHIEPKTFRDGSGYFESELRPGQLCAKVPDGDMLFVGESREPMYFASVNEALAAIRIHKSRDAQTHGVQTAGGQS